MRGGRYVAGIHEVAEAAARDLDCEALGVVIEDKRTVLAIHYRLAEDAAATRHQILARVIDPARERGLSIATGQGIERDLFALAFATEDQTEGMAAFLEKRAPEFGGR